MTIVDDKNIYIVAKEFPIYSNYSIFGSVRFVESCYFSEKIIFRNRTSIWHILFEFMVFIRMTTKRGSVYRPSRPQNIQPLYSSFWYSLSISSLGDMLCTDM